ncbi:integrase_H2C2 domain-containing protein [Trichonephila clavipes]|nr:integrase_H2C2 domain-containing protein [Trichonephila clavipes]
MCISFRKLAGESSKPWQVKRAGLGTSFAKTANVLKSELVNVEFSVDLECDKFTKLQSVYLYMKILDLLVEDRKSSENNIANEIEDCEVYSDYFITLSRQKIHSDPDLHESNKFSYLVQCLKPGSRGREFIESYPVTSENYDNAVLVLKERFGKPELLVDVFVRELIKMIITNVKANNRDKLPLGRLYDKIEPHLRALESLGIKSKENIAWLFPMEESCLTEDF